MNVEDLQLIHRSQTANEVLKFFSQRQRISNETTLDSFKNYLSRLFKVNTEEFYNLFVELQEAGAGKLVEHQGKQRGKFIWNYSLRDVSEQILNPNKKIDLQPLIATESNGTKTATITPLDQAPKRTRGRQPKAATTPKAEGEVVYIAFKTSKGECIPISLTDADRLFEEVKIVRAKLG